MSEEKKELTDKDIAVIMEAISKAYEAAGRTIQTAVLVDEIDEEGNVSGEVLLDARSKEDIQ